MGFKKLLAGASASAFVAAAALIGLPGTAQAAPSIEVTPNQNLKGGDEVDVSVSGMPASASIAVGICQKGRPSGGPGDCAAAKDGHSVLAVSDADGNVSATLVVPEGASGNTAAPFYDCGPNDPCVVAASSIGGEDGAKVEVDLNYASAAAEAPADEPEPETDAGAGAGAGNAAGDEGELSQTGPRETLIIALVGFALFQIGLVFAVRGARAGRQTAV